jgi:hypothetical protein
MLLLVAGGGFLSPNLLRVALGRGAGAGLLQRAEQQRSARVGSSAEATRRYSRFTHQVAKHKQACDSCHRFPSSNWKQVRKGEEAFPDVTDYPQHASCLQCHRQQFFSGAVPTICSVCHTSPSPSNSARYPFANPREAFDSSPKGKTAFSEYKVYFPHQKHDGLFGQTRPRLEPDRRGRLIAVSFNHSAPDQDQSAKNNSCSKCHQTHQKQGDSDEEFVTKPPKDLPENAFWLRRDTFKTSPQSHTICFTCHSQDGGLPPASADCATCHKLILPEQAAARREAHGDFDPKAATTMAITDRSTLEKWSKREAVRFRHDWVTHVDLACVDCHKTAAIDTLAENGPKVPVLSCGGGGTGCHITTTIEDGGALNVELGEKKSNPSFQCTKCHAFLGKQQVPDSHFKALAAVKASQ